MDNMKFKEEDKEKVIEFLNLVAKYAKFEMNTEELIKYFKALAHMQSSILPKIESNIMEVIKVVEPEPKKKTRSKVSK